MGPHDRHKTNMHTYRNKLTERQTWNTIHACHFVQCFNSATIQHFSECDHQCWSVLLACLYLLPLKLNSGCADIPMYVYHQLQAHTFPSHVKLSDVGHLFLDPSLMTPGWSANSAYHSTHPAMLKAPADCKAHGKFHLESLLCKS